MRFSLILPSRGSAKNRHGTAGILAVPSSLGSAQAGVSAENDAQLTDSVPPKTAKNSQYEISSFQRKPGIPRAGLRR
jgi:hypothetical protein